MNQFFQFAQCPLYFMRNGVPILLFVSSLRINFQNSLEPQYIVTSPSAQTEAARGGMKIQFDINFFPLFSDPLYVAINNRSDITLRFGNLIFTNGYASNFDLQGQYGEVVKGSCKITFFDQFIGDTFSPIQFMKTQANFINDADWRIAQTTLSQLYLSLDVTSKMGFSYSYNSQFAPKYLVGSYLCQGVIMDKRNIAMTITSDNINNYVTTLGTQAQATLNLKDICGNSLEAIRTIYGDIVNGSNGPLTEDIIYTCNGFVESSDTSLDTNNIINSNISIREYL